jgi:hypothetical protein
MLIEFVCRLCALDVPYNAKGIAGACNNTLFINKAAAREISIMLGEHF